MSPAANAVTPPTSAPGGYANVMAHLVAHQDAEQLLAEQLQQRRAQVQAAGLRPYIYVSSANTVTFEYCNDTSSSVTPVAQTVQIRVVQ